MKSHNYKGTVHDCFIVPDEMKCNIKPTKQQPYLKLHIYVSLLGGQFEAQF